MTLNFQNKIVFPAPETSYTTQSAFGQVIYIPRNIMQKAEAKFAKSRSHLNNLKADGQSRPSNSARSGSTTTASLQGESSSREGSTTERDDTNQQYSDKAQAMLEDKKNAQEKRQSQGPKFSEDDPLQDEIRAQQAVLGGNRDEQFEDLDIIQESEYVTEQFQSQVREEQPVSSTPATSSTTAEALANLNKENELVVEAAAGTAPADQQQQLEQSEAGIADDIETFKAADEDQEEDVAENNSQEEKEDDLTNVRNSAQTLEVSKMIPSEGLQTKSHSAKQPEDKEETKAKAKKESGKEGKNSFVWGPQTRTSIKKQKNPQQVDDENGEYIPCLYLPCEDGGNKVCVYFHGNAEDIGLAFDLMYMFGASMQMHVLAVEYPGYGLYKTSKPDEEKMKEDADTIYDYMTQIVGVKESDMILFGRSMGSGPTSYLASRKECHSLLLMSPYMSIKDAAKSLLGWASFLTMIVYERFRNIDLIAEAKCPVFFLHGQKDTLIPHQHSIELNRVCPKESYLHLPADMDHNEFQLEEDLVAPFKQFIQQLEAPQRKQNIEFRQTQLEAEQEEAKNTPTQGQGAGDTVTVAQPTQEEEKKDIGADAADPLPTVSETEPLPSLPSNADTKFEQDWSGDRKIEPKLKNGQVRHPSDPFKYKYMINRHEKLDIHCNLFDSSFVEYFLDDPNGNFDILFDQKLYEPAKLLIDFEKQMQEEQEAAQKSRAGR